MTVPDLAPAPAEPASEAVVAEPPPPAAPAPEPEPTPVAAAAVRDREPAAAPRPAPVAAVQEPERAPPRPTPPPKLRVTDRDPIHDPANPAYARLQKPSEALRDMPLDRMGRVNWVAALAQGLVAPRASVDGSGRMKVLESDIVMTDTRSMPHVLFPHGAHTQWLSCDNCHPEPFIAGNNANPINMDAIFLGRYCGVCHDKVAFSTFVCERCHSIPHAGSPAKWW